MNEAEGRRWYRSSPWIGALGGALLASYIHVFGSVPRRRWHLGNWLLRELNVATLFEISPLASYVVFIGFGMASGWALRRFEDRYFRSD